MIKLETMNLTNEIPENTYTHLLTLLIENHFHNVFMMYNQHVTN